MKEFVCVVVLLCLAELISAKMVHPKVQVYSRNPGEYGKQNVFICHVSGFHPPEIRIELLHNGKELADSKQTDLAFEENWHYHLTKHAAFTPKQGDTFACRVTHMEKQNTFNWEPDM